MRIESKNLDGHVVGFCDLSWLTLILMIVAALNEDSYKFQEPQQHRYYGPGLRAMAVIAYKFLQFYNITNQPAEEQTHIASK